MRRLLLLLPLAVAVLLCLCAVGDALPVDSSYGEGLLDGLDLPGEDSGLSKCDLCKHALRAVMPLFKSNKTLERIVDVAIPLCKHIGGAGFCKGKRACDDLCPGIVRAYAPAAVTVIFQNGDVGADQLCDFLKVCSTPQPIHPFPGPVPGVGLVVHSNLSDVTGQRQWPQWSDPSRTQGVGTFLHLTDIHLDVQYIEGALAECGEPTCCRARNGPPAKGQRVAGRWGDYGCDTSPQLAESLWREIGNNYATEVDFAIVTGDEPTHDVWMQTQIHNIAAIDTVTTGVMSALRDVPTFFCLGNHAVEPADLYAPGASSYLFEKVASAWSAWLPAQAISTLREGGYYAAQARPGLTIIAMHTTPLTADDLWIRVNATAHDFTGQLPWLNDTLRQVREQGHKAFIIGHARPTEFVEPLRSAFYEIAKANEDIIDAYLFGHTHPFELSLMRMDDSQPAFATTYAVGSVTTFTDLNPGFRVWKFDRESAELTGWRDYWVDLVRANAWPDVGPVWALQYEAPQFFNMTSISPQAWDDLARRLPHDVNLAKAWNWAWSKGGPATPFPAQKTACMMLMLGDCSHL